MSKLDIPNHRHADLRKDGHLHRGQHSGRARHRMRVKTTQEAYLATFREATWTTGTSTWFPTEMDQYIAADVALARCLLATRNLKLTCVRHCDQHCEIRVSNRLMNGAQR